MLSEETSLRKGIQKYLAFANETEKGLLSWCLRAMEMGPVIENPVAHLSLSSQ